MDETNYDAAISLSGIISLAILSVIYVILIVLIIIKYKKLINLKVVNPSNNISTNKLNETLGVKFKIKIKPLNDFLIIDTLVYLNFFFINNLFYFIYSALFFLLDMTHFFINLFKS